MLVDQTNDTGFATLRVLVQRYSGLRDMCKTAELDPREFSSLPADSFAWPGERQYPIHNKEQAALSLAYSKVASSPIPSDVRARLEKAAEMYDIPKDSFDSPVLEKQAAAEFWLLPEKKRFRVASAEQVKIAEGVLHEKYAQMSTYDRAEAFLQLHNAAEHFNVALTPSTEKLAGFTITSTQILKDWIEARQEAATKIGSELAPAYELLASKFRGVRPYLTQRNDQIKLASLLNEMDKQSGVDKFYGKSILDPLQTVFNTEKLASDALNLGGYTFSLKKLAALPPTFWSDALGSDIMREIAPDGNVKLSMLKEILPTLPQDLKVTIGRQLAAYR
jgi:hypothetical protein